MFVLSSISVISLQFCDLQVILSRLSSSHHSPLASRVQISMFDLARLECDSFRTLLVLLWDRRKINQKEVSIIQASSSHSSGRLSYVSVLHMHPLVNYEHEASADDCIREASSSMTRLRLSRFRSGRKSSCVSTSL